MTGAEPVCDLPVEKREKLISIIYTKRAAFLIYYVIAGVVSGIGLLSNVTTAAGFVIQDMPAWILGMTALFTGAVIVTLIEVKRRFTLYIITTWNLRIRRGIITRTTTRVFYDEILSVQTSISADEKPALMGDVRVFKMGSPNEPALVFKSVHNPEGIREVICRFIQSTPQPLPWSHIKR
ncbi:MAG: hypothetical protein C4K49_06335 [Candidatus Thorarchaeota archaeon]|nr:MAG: hypothetical protein C4K49_06335 [Candidatus Thorarchaeota archaeon]